MTPEEITKFCKENNLSVIGTNKDRILKIKKFLGIKISYENEPFLSNKSIPTRDKISIIEKNREERRQAQEEIKKYKSTKYEENISQGRCGDVDFELLVDT